MKEYFIQYKPFLLFLAKFFISYLVLTFIYQSYLNQFDEKKYEVDGFTKTVANQTASLLSIVDNQSYTKPNEKEPCMNLYYQNHWSSRIIEGCNGLSVIILFIAFVIAFSGTVKRTLLFVVIGSIIIHIFNVIRIALLSVLITKFPSIQHILHDVVFPLFIYGIVFILWVIWVNNYSTYAKKSA